MKWIAASMLAAWSVLSYAAVDIVQDPAAVARLTERVRTGEASVDHIALIGKYKYLVYIDRTTTPLTVLMKPSEETPMMGSDPAHEAMVAQYKKTMALGHGLSAKPAPAASAETRNGAGQDRAAFGRLWDQVSAGAIQHDHIALIGKYRYYVYIDRSTTPITVLIKHTEEALDDLFDSRNLDSFEETLDRQDELVEQYRDSLIAKTSSSSVAKPKRSKIKTVDVPVQETGNGPTDFYDCTDFYDKPYRNRVYTNVGGSLNTVEIDTEGRPGQSYITWMTVPVAVVQNDNCRKEVGKWGKNSDVGGHAVARQNGGWGSRANFTPQNGKLNNGEWRKIENLVQFCTKQGYFPVTFNNIITYQNILKVELRPEYYNPRMLATRPSCPPSQKYEGANVGNRVPNTNDQMSIDYMVRTFRDFCSGRGFDLTPPESCSAQN